ncbi:MAG: acyltransferase family protein [Fibrobacteres bacterium]|nr:acyltransferase family protein [Fibrobacterota bacterium]
MSVEPLPKVREFWLDRLRVLATLAVVGTHVAVFAGTASESRGTSGWWLGAIFYGFCRWCVPVWVMISGALLLSGPDHQSITQFYKRRISRILVPLLGWSVFYSGWTFLRSSIKGEPLPWMHQLLATLDVRAYYQLWFLLPLLMVYFATPFLRMIVRESTDRQVLGISIAIWIYFLIGFVHGLVNQREGGLNMEGFIPFLSLFLLGYVLRRWRTTFAAGALVATFGVLSIIGIGLWGKATSVAWQQFFNTGLNPLNLVASAALFLFVRQYWAGKLSGWESDFAQASLGVYLVHPLVLDVIWYALSRLHLNVSVNIPLLFVGVSLGSWFFARTLAKVPFLRKFV